MNKETQGFITNRIDFIEGEIKGLLRGLQSAQQEVINHEREIQRKTKIIEGLQQMSRIAQVVAK